LGDIRISIAGGTVALLPTLSKTSTFVIRQLSLSFDPSLFVLLDITATMKTAVLLLAVSAMASAQAAGPWAQCGGIGFTGPTTCVAGKFIMDSEALFHR
jgi:hypothetical protein